MSSIGKTKLRPGLLAVSGDRVFHSIQGEGLTLGCPAVFLRLHFCNLNCSWCDTRYTWDQSLEEFTKELVYWTIDEALTEIKKFNCRRLVVTGGEPLIQATMLTELVKSLPAYQIEIETNGTIMPTSPLQERAWFNISPKLSNSGIDLTRRIKKIALESFAAINNSTFKFVAKEPKCLKEVIELITEVGIAYDKVLIMPEATSLVEMQARLEILAPLARDLGLRLIPRLHTLIWGQERRV